MSGFLWKATVGNVNRALKEVNAFEWEGDYRPETAKRLKAILEERMDEELEQYLGRAKHERRGEGDREDYRNGSYLRHLLTEIGDLIVRIPRSRKGFVLKVLEAYKRRSRSVDQLIMACNATLDDEDEEIILKKYYNIGVATDTPEGLMVPVVKNAVDKSILQLAEELTQLAEKARNRTIDLADLKGGTFTITNYGALGGIYGTPIINHPEVAILGTGKIKDTPVVRYEKVEIRKILFLALSFDHRIVDGAEAARFLNTVIARLEDPDLILLET